MTDEDKKLILEWCGFKFDGTYWKAPDGLYWLSIGFTRDGIWFSRTPPNLDLNFYFKYAVPKLGYAEVTYKYYLSGMTYYAKVGDAIFRDAYNKDDPAEAFGQALLKLIKGGRGS